jgi:dihydrofolate reductase
MTLFCVSQDFFELPSVDIYEKMRESLRPVMRKITMFLLVSLDGYFEGPNHDISWHNVDSEFNKFAIEQLRNTDLLMFGRRTYQLMESSWPEVAKDPRASKENLEIAKLINETKKIVFSKTLEKVVKTVYWQNIRLVHEFNAEEIRQLKQQPGKEISVGGPDLVKSFIKAELIDEFRFLINPIIIGNGTPVLKGEIGKLCLELVSERKFNSGNVLLCYRPARK